MKLEAAGRITTVKPDETIKRAIQRLVCRGYSRRRKIEWDSENEQELADFYETTVEFDGPAGRRGWILIKVIKEADNDN